MIQRLGLSLDPVRRKALFFLVSRLTAAERWRWAAILAPAFGAVTLGAFVLPDRFAAVLGLAAGWIVAGLLLFRESSPTEYRQAVKLLRQNRYADAVKEMDRLMKRDPECPGHYHLRAEILRVWGQLDRARRDYQKMTQLAPDSPVAFNGLSEVELQTGNYDSAHAAAIKAAEFAPEDWVALYNLGMIEDRMRSSEAVIQHVNRALDKKITDSRQRLLAYLFLARAHARLGNWETARETVITLKKQRKGLREWQILLQGDQAETLKAMLGTDVEMARALADGELDVEALGDG